MEKNVTAESSFFVVVANTSDYPDAEYEWVWGSEPRIYTTEEDAQAHAQALAGEGNWEGVDTPPTYEVEVYSAEELQADTTGLGQEFNQRFAIDES